MNELQAFTSLFQALPAIVDAINKCDELNRDHEHRMTLKYSQEAFFKSILAMYKAGNITADEAKQAAAMVFKSQQTIELDQIDPVEKEIMAMLGKLN